VATGVDLAAMIDAAAWPKRWSGTRFLPRCCGPGREPGRAAGCHPKRRSGPAGRCLEVLPPMPRRAAGRRAVSRCP